MPHFARPILLSVACLALQPSSAAANNKWTSNGPNTDWFTAANWSLGVLPISSQTCFASVDNGGRAVVAVPGAVAGIVYVGLNNAGQNTLEISGTGTLTSLAGNVGFNTGAFGRVALSGGSWTTGDTFIGARGSGSIVISGAGSMAGGASTLGQNAGAVGSVIVSDQGTWSNTSRVTIGITGNGSVTQNGGSISAGNVVMATDAAGSGGTLTLNGGTLTTSQITEGSGSGVGGGSGTVLFNGGKLRLAVVQTVLFAGFEPGDVTMGGGGGTIDTQGFAITSALGLAGSGPLFKLGTGTLTLTGNSTHSGGTTVREGTLAIPSGSVSHAGRLTIGDAAGDAGMVEISGSGAVTTSGAYLGLNAGASGVLALKGGVLTVGQVFEVAGSGTVQFTGGTLRFSADDNNIFFGFEAGDVTFGAGGGTMDTQAFSIGTQLPLAGTGGLTKQGTGTLSLAASNTYTGATSVEAGTLDLRVITSFAGGPITVKSGGALSAQGALTAPVIVQSGGGIAPGGENDIATLTNSSTTLGGTVNCQVAAATADRWNAGALTLSGSPSIAFTVPGPAPAAASYLIATYTSLTGSLGSLTFTGVPAGYVVNTDVAGEIKLVKSAGGFSTWADGWPGLTDKTTGGNPSGDGITNLMKFVIGGDPRFPSTAQLPVQTIIGGNLVLSYQRSDESEGTTTQTGQWSTDALTWNDIAPVLVNENGSAPDDMTISIPRSNAAGGKLYARLKVTLP